MGRFLANRRTQTNLSGVSPNPGWLPCRSSHREWSLCTKPQSRSSQLGSAPRTTRKARTSSPPHHADRREARFDRDQDNGHPPTAFHRRSTASCLQRQPLASIRRRKLFHGGEVESRTVTPGLPSIRQLSGNRTQVPKENNKSPSIPCITAFLSG